MGLPAKTSAPRLTNAVPRARVFKCLDRALSKGAVWVAAPAGAGKTTAVGSFLRARRRAAVWYDVDASDTDFANVFLYLASALRAMTRSRQAVPALSLQHHTSVRSFARKFFEAFYTVLPKGAALVLDNCHTVAGDETWTQILEEAMRAVPDGRHLVMVSRTEPPAGFARQLVNDGLALVTGNELRFTVREAGQLARARVPGLGRRRKGALTALCALADGWAAGLVLVLEHASRSEHKPAPVADHGPLLEYFSAEVLAELPPEAQQQLLSTALLPVMTEATACAVSGNPGTGALLADLHRRGLLVERLMTTSASYRFHPLFRAFLLGRAQPSADVLGRAASVCAEHGLLDEAVELHARVSDQGQIAQLALQHAPRLVAEGRTQTLGAWLARLDEATLAAEPWLRFWQAMANLPLHQVASRTQFEQAFEGFTARGDAAGLYLCVAGAVQVIFIECMDLRKLDPWFERFTLLGRDGPLPPSEAVEATTLTSVLNAVSFRRPGLPEAADWARRALSLAVVDLPSRVQLWSSLILYLSITDQLALAAEFLIRVRSAGSATLDPVTRLFTKQAQMSHLMLRGSSREALTAAEQGLALVRSAGLRIFEATYLGAVAQAAAHLGDHAIASAYLGQAEDAARDVASYFFRQGYFDFAKGELLFLAGQPASAIPVLAAALEDTRRNGVRWGEALVSICYYASLIAAGRLTDARVELTRFSAWLDGEPLGLPRANARLLEAELSLRAGDEAEGTRLLTEALATAQHGRVGWVLLYAAALPNVLARGLCDPTHSAWLAEHIIAQRLPPAAEHLDLEAWPFAFRIRAMGGFALKGPSLSQSRKAQNAPLRLLKCLISAGGAPLSARAACDELWSDESPTAARRLFDTTLHRLRKLLGDDLVQLSQGALTLDRTRCFVDAWAFSSLADRVERGLRKAPGGAADGYVSLLFENALRLYRGPFLAGDDDLPVVLRHRERLRARFVKLVLAFGGSVEPASWDQAADVYTRALELDDLAEPLYQGLMRGLLLAGRPAAAIEQHQRCQLALHAAGSSPSEGTRELYAEARARLRAGEAV